MYKGYARKDKFFSKRLTEFFVITDETTVREVVDLCRETSATDVYDYQDFTIVETAEIAYAVKRITPTEEVAEQALDEPTKVIELLEDGGKEINTKKAIFGDSTKFLSLLLAIILALTCVPSLNVYAVTGSLSDSQTDISPLNGVQFTTSVGSVGVNPTYADTSGKELAFSLLDPRPLGQSLQARPTAIPAGLNSRFLEAVLMYRKAYSLNDIKNTTGLTVSAAQVDAATQLSIWKHVLAISNSFHIQEASVQDTTVRSLSTHIETWARTQLTVIPKERPLTEAILPAPIPLLNTSSVIKSVEGTATKIGPYTFLSNPAVTLDASISKGHITDAAGNVINEVKTSTPFYVVLPQDITGVQTVRLSGKSKEFQIFYSQGRLWLEPKEEDIKLSFNVGGTAGATGMIEITALDSLTGLPLANVSTTIKTDTASIGTSVSGDNGVMSKETPVGSFTIDIQVPPGFQKFESFKLNVDFIGEIKTMTITIQRTDAVVDFKLIDITTYATLGEGEAFLYKDMKPYRRFAFAGGQVNGVLLPPGKYSISMYYTTGGYSISGQVPFVVEQGTKTEVAIPLTPNSPLTTISLENTMNRTQWIFSFSRGAEVLFEIPTNGLHQLRFVPGSDIQVIAKSADGSISLPPFNFTTGLQDTNVTIPVVVGTETVTFNIVDTQILAPIPYVVMGLFDQDHRLLDVQTARADGVVVFKGLVYGNVYYINAVGVPPEVSGYSANGNRFLGRTREFTLQLCSQAEMKEYSKKDTVWRLPTITYTGPNYKYPQKEVRNEPLSPTTTNDTSSLPVQSPSPKPNATSKGTSSN